MTVRLFLSGERVGPQLARSAAKNIKKIRAAERGAAQDVVDYVVPLVRQDIASAGKFGTRWTSGFQGKVTEGGGFVRVAFTQAVKYWRVFQFGAVIHGKPLLFIPFSFASDAQNINARDYPGKLFRVTRKSDGLIMLLSPVGGHAEPKYFGKEQVTIPKKFHTIEIIRDGAKKMKSFYRERMKNG